MTSRIREENSASLPSFPSSTPSTSSSPLLERRESSSNMSLDLSHLPSLDPPIPASNTLVFTGLVGPGDFDSERLFKLRVQVDSLSSGSLIHWGLVPSFGRIFAVFKTTTDALVVRRQLDGTIYNGKTRIHIYFGEDTPIEPLLLRNRKGPMSEIERERDTVHLQLPDPGRLFLISPPPSPPVGWESQVEPPPNTDVGLPADELNDALTKLMRGEPKYYREDFQAPVSLPRIMSSELRGACGAKFELYSDIASGASSPRSPSVVIMPPDDSDGKPGIIVSDFSTDTLANVGTMGVAGVKTERPPVKV
ncbi:Calcipressin-domain-containing protein [Lipomyces tetrasporus]